MRPLSTEGCTPNRHMCCQFLLRMLYGCGLRISEALHLTIQDVDLNKGTLYIRNTKFNKERILPWPIASQEDAKNILKLSVSEKWGNPFFFPSPFGGHYSETTIYKLFREVLRQAKISHLGKGKGPVSTISDMSSL